MAIVTQRTASMLFYGNIVVRISPKLFYSNSSLYIQYPTQAPRFTLWSQQFVYQVAVCLFDSGPLLQRAAVAKVVDGVNMYWNTCPTQSLIAARRKSNILCVCLAPIINYRDIVSSFLEVLTTS